MSAFSLCRLQRGWVTKVSLVLFLIFSLILYGSAGLAESPGQAAKTCGAWGAAAGAGIGAAVEGSWKGALIGSLVGALAGATLCFAIANYRNDQAQTYQETQQAVSYQPSQGGLVKITDFGLTPETVQPGQQVAFNARYQIMTPDPDQDLEVTEIRIIKFFDPQKGAFKEVGHIDDSVTIKPGTRQASGNIKINSEVVEGFYMIALKVSYGDKSDVREMPLRISKG